MPSYLQITFRGMRASPAVRAKIEERVAGLERFIDPIMSCRVVVHAPHRHQRKGGIYHVSIDLKVPGHEIAVNRDPPEHQAHEDAYVAVRDAFDAVERRLEDVARRRRGSVKAHAAEPRGEIVRLFPDKDYGFIQSADGDEVYFHANSVSGRAFSRLKVGDKVRYTSEAGDKGLQAAVVKPVSRRRAKT
ncbi:MAG: HPF/RaiA family ribosome-associated protein [Alphaproteobacteria bacterium]